MCIAKLEYFGHIFISFRTRKNTNIQMSQQRGLGKGEGSWAARVIVYGVFVLFLGIWGSEGFFFTFLGKICEIDFFLVFLEVLYDTNNI